MQQKRRAWTRVIEKTKASQFLDEAGEGKLWKVATYMKPRETWGCIPALRVGSEELVQYEDKAKAFLDTFFPATNTPDPSPPALPQAELPWHPITELEIERSLKAAQGATAPGEDNLPMLVWKKLWCESIVLRKPGKPDYAVPGAYRPISLLNTPGKLLEAVMTRRLSYLAGKYGLLPNSQFGGRPGRTTEQALLVLSNAINKAWYKHKVRKWSPLSPILFAFFNADLADQPVDPHGGARRDELRPSGELRGSDGLRGAIN
ncbi:hypothetical protein EYZ11_009368 [Aspergillus tanneri]|uniref:Uncharacterized protein n=1 Tax=Aspergillus tanneri TaxID=1220188 RepID=A0A4S3J835_9EURO|nr:hypothetical protein EYZ11_009368 [Aspergillus tanneri]